jgi:hypothetical protein
MGRGRDFSQGRDVVDDRGVNGATVVRCGALIFWDSHSRAFVHTSNEVSFGSLVK